MLTFLKFLILWIFTGFVLNNFCGWLLGRIMMRAFSEDKESCYRRVTIKNMQQNGYFENPTGLDLIWNDIIWPITIFYAFIGFVKIMRERKKTNENC